MTGWQAAGWLTEHRPSREETQSLLGIIERDLRDSEVEALSPDTQLGLAYNAALQAGTVALAACGYRAARERKHYITIQSLAHTISEGASLKVTGEQGVIKAFQKRCLSLSTNLSPQSSTSQSCGLRGPLASA